jgi:hypothetical protein
MPGWSPPDVRLPILEAAGAPCLSPLDPHGSLFVDAL